ncbi:Aldo/keto reductase family protein [Actinacidiphila paucisporea]|uniref:Aldo/keto reductase family protein n=1 Tax=Actinacidiphila paucisporea TaxID=310782 RepID=A0A1M7QN83_9ACTN|nr:Aldo/keto reductase family protein [Actinacidiphila paucisporea]
MPEVVQVSRLGAVRVRWPACAFEVRQEPVGKGSTARIALLDGSGAPSQDGAPSVESLVREGAIGSWGVSNLDVEYLADLPPGAVPQTDQVLYNLTRRGPEHRLLPRCRELSIPVMAYSPVEQGRLLGHPALREVAAAHGATPAQIALAWVLRHEDVIAIPKASSRGHVRENRAAKESPSGPRIGRRPPADCVCA